MAKEDKPIDADSIPGLLRIVEEVRDSGEARVITRADEELAILTPLRPKAKRPQRRRKTGILTKDDAIWNIVGMAESAEPTDVARHKHEYLAEAYADLHK